MSAYLFTEGALEAALLERLVKCHPLLAAADIRVRHERGTTSALVAARTVLYKRRFPVAIVTSPETLSPRLISEQQGQRDWLMGRAGAPDEFLVLLVPPEIPVLLFRDEGVMNAVLPPMSFESRIRGRYEPNAVLKELFAEADVGPYPDVLVERLSRADLFPLWKQEVLKPLEAFLLRVCLGQSAGSPSAP